MPKGKAQAGDTPPPSDTQDAGAAEAAPASPVSTETRTVTIDGVVYAWTEATEHTVPEEARLVYARSKAVGG